MVNNFVSGNREVLQLQMKCCYHSRDVYISVFFYSVKISLATGDCKTGNKLIVVEMMCSDGMQNLSGLVLLYPISICF